MPTTSIPSTTRLIPPLFPLNLAPAQTRTRKAIGLSTPISSIYVLYSLDQIFTVTERDLPGSEARSGGICFGE